jgi:outer membrane protein assembly factor BamB
VPQQPKTPPKPVRPEQVVWEFPESHPAAAALMAMRNAPAVDPAGRIYLHAGDRLVALTVADDRPTVAWEYVTGCRVPGPVVVGLDGNIRLHASDGCLHCLSDGGRQAWPPVHVGEPLGYAAPAVDARGNTWVSAFEGGLHRIDVEGRLHKPAPFFRSRQKLNAGGLIHDGVLYIGSEDGYVFAVQLDGERGENRWNHAGGHGETGWYVHSTPAMSAEGMLVVAGRDENLYGFRLDGTPGWRTQMPGQLLGSPVLDRFGHIYVGVSQSQRGHPPRGLLVCVDGNSHKVRWEYKAAGHVESTAVIGDDDVLYFGDNAGVVHAVDFRGAAQWTVALDSPVRSAGTILAPQRLAFGLDSETLVVLKCSSQGLAAEGWPKIGRTLGQSGMA